MRNNEWSTAWGTPNADQTTKWHSRLMRMTSPLNGQRTTHGFKKKAAAAIQALDHDAPTIRHRHESSLQETTSSQMVTVLVVHWRVLNRRFPRGQIRHIQAQHQTLYLGRRAINIFRRSLWHQDHSRARLHRDNEGLPKSAYSYITGLYLSMAA